MEGREERSMRNVAFYCMHRSSSLPPIARTSDIGLPGYFNLDSLRRQRLPILRRRERALRCHLCAARSSRWLAADEWAEKLTETPLDVKHWLQPCYM